MKKFILLMLLTSAMSAHAVGQASEQIDTNQNEDSDEELNKAIELSLVDQDIEEEKKRENALSLSANTQRNNPVSEQIDTFQRNVQQNNLGFDEDCEEEAIRKAIEKENEEARKKAIEKISKSLTPEEAKLNSQNQRSAFEEDEVAPAAPAPAQEIPTEPTQNTRVIACRNPQNKTYDERGMAEPYSEQVGRSNDMLKVIFGYLSTDRAHYITSLLNKKIHGHFDLDFTKNDSAKYSHFKIQNVLTFNVVLPPNIIKQLKATLNWRKDKGNPVKRLTLASIQNALALKEVIQPPENEEAAKNFSNEEKNAIALKGSKIPVIVGSIADSRQNFLYAFAKNNAKKLPFDQWIKECFGTVLLENIRITNRLTIAQALQIKKWAIPVKVGLIVDSWRTFWRTFLNSNPDNLPFKEWKTACFGTVSPEKMALRIDDNFVRPQEWVQCAAFLNANQAHLNPNNFTITIERVHTTRDALMNSLVFPYLTGMKDFHMHYRKIPLDHLRVCLQNNAPTLTTLDLTYTYCATTDNLAGVLKKMELVEQLTLGGNNIDDEAMKDLGPAFANMRALTTLSLSGNKIGAEGLGDLKAIFDNNTLKTLNLSSNNIGAEGVEYLANALRTNTSITRLDLSGNNISVKGVEILSDALSKNSTLEVLDLGNNKISAEGAMALADALRTNTSLKVLKLGNNNIGAEGVKYLTDALRTNVTLEELNLSRNNISSERLRDLKAIFDNNTLKTLDLSYNNIGAEGAMALANALRTNGSLEVLNLWQNNFSDEEVRDLANALQTNTSLKKLDLQYNNIGDDGARALLEALSKNSTLKVLDLWGNKIYGGVQFELREICRTKNIDLKM